MTRTPHSITVFLLLGWSACHVDSATHAGTDEDDGGAAADTAHAADGDDDGSDGSDDGEPPDQDPGGSAEYPATRAMTRLTADQYVAALEVVTGQRWERFEEFASALGKPDFVASSEDLTALSVSFDKLAHDAARDTCRQALDLDLAGKRPGQPVLLRFANASERSPDALVSNLQYLYLRFLVEWPEPGDPRLEPFMQLLQAPAPDGEELSDQLMADRWWAVCVALSTHPDFVTY